MTDEATTGVRRPTNRERILDASLTLFNERGTPAVSTKTIAAHLGISPGNLYYHFANKEEIIWELWNQALASIAPGIAPPDDGSLLPPEEFAAMLVVILRNMATYRFIVRDLDELMARDPKLAESLREQLAVGQKLCVAVFDSLIEGGVMAAPRDHEDLERLGVSILTLLMNWLRYLVNMRGLSSGGDAELADGALHAFVLLEPRFKARYAQRARAALESRIHDAAEKETPKRTTRRAPAKRG